MNKTQRARLYALTAQATRTEAEAAVFAQLQALAALHPNAALDTEDPATATASTTSPAAVVAAPVVATAQPGTLTTVIAGVMANIRGRAAVGADLAASRATITQLTTERDQARTALATAESARTTAQGHLAAFCAFFALKPESLAGQTAEQLQTTLTNAIAGAATAQLATMGVPAATLPAPANTVSADSKPDELMAEYAALANAGKSEEAAQFFAKNLTPKFAQPGRN
jgi:hypothetical protein